MFAWRTSDYARGAALVGKNGFEITFEPKCDAVLAEGYKNTEAAEEIIKPLPCHTLIGPNGTTTEVGRGFGKNLGDFDLVVIDGKVIIRGVHYDKSGCSVDDFSGDVRILGHEVIPPGDEGGKFVAFVTVEADAPRDCQGELVYYKVVIEAENPTPRPVDEVSLR